MQIISPRDTSGKGKIRNRDFLPIFVVGASVLGLVNLLLLFGNLIFTGSIATKPAPTLVELADGQSVQVQPMGSKDRTPEAIQDYTTKTLAQLFDFRGTTPSTDPQNLGIPVVDPGVSIADNTKVTSRTWQAGFSLSEEFRPGMLRKIAELTPNSIFTESGTQGTLVTRSIGQPESIEPGKWRVPYVGNLIIFEGGDNLGKAIPFNKHIYVQAVNTPALPSDATSLQKNIWQARQAGLEIYAMQDLSLSK